MATQPQAPVLIKPVPAQIVNENATFGPLDLTQFIQSPDAVSAVSGAVRFRAELSNGMALPAGIICTAAGIINGIAAPGTQGSYEIVITAENESLTPLETQFALTIQPSLAAEQAEFWHNLKSRIWEAVGQDLPIPDLGEYMMRPITATEIYYLLQRYATLTIWDVYNLEPPGEKVVLHLEGENKHYHLYDRGSCLIAAPKDLYSLERTLEDALQAARSLAREAYNRGWTIEFAGFDKMMRAAWVELQIMADKHGKEVDVLHFTPTSRELKIYTSQAEARKLAAP